MGLGDDPVEEERMRARFGKSRDDLERELAEARNGIVELQTQLRLCEQHAGTMAADFDASLAVVQAERDALRTSEERAIEFCIGLCGHKPEELRAIWKERDELRIALAALRDKRGYIKLLGGVGGLKKPAYHTLNQHSGRNDRLLHAVLCAYAKHHLDCADIGWDELSEILWNVICNELGDTGAMEWGDTIKRDPLK